MIDIKCQHCGRWLGKTDQTMIAVIKCSNSKCKKDNDIKVVLATSTDEQIRYIFKENEDVRK